MAAYGSSTSRIIDRFFLSGSRIRGYDVVGPRTAPVDGGLPSGDGLGGEAKAFLSLRALLPPPFPSVRLANSGLRTQLWATAGGVSRADSVASLSNLWRTGTLSAGVGVVRAVAARAS